MNANPTSSEPEFSRPLSVEKIPAAGIVKTLEANEAERRKLAARFGLLELSKLQAELTIKSARAGRAVEVTGNLIADVVQRCVVTTEPVPDHIESDIEILYTFGEKEDDAPKFIDPAEVEIEPIVDGMIDLGELVAQNLGVALNPYPRKPGAVFEAAVPGEVVTPPSPLAKLAELTQKAKDKSKG